MAARLHWLIERKAVTLWAFVVVLLGAFIPWPSEVIAIVVVILGALLMLAQIPFAIRAAQRVPSQQTQFPEIPSIPMSSAHSPSEPVASAQVPAGQPEAQRRD